MESSNASSLIIEESKSDVCILHLPPDRIDFPPLKAALLAARLKNCGFKVALVDFNVSLRRNVKQQYQSLWQPVNEHYWHDKNQLSGFLHENEDLIATLINKVTDTGAKLIVVDLCFPVELFWAELIKKIKKIRPGLKVIATGRSCLVQEQQEEIQNLCQHSVNFFLSSGSLVTLPGFLFELSREKKLQITAKQCAGLERYLARKQQDIAKILPDYGGAQLALYRGKCFAVSVGMGCNARCDFCFKHLCRDEEHLRPAEDIVQEMLSLQKEYGAESFYFSGAPVNWKSSIIEAVCDSLLKIKLTVSWSAEVTPFSEISSGLLYKMKQAGCHTLHLCGVSGSHSVLTHAGAGFTKEQTETLLEKVGCANIRCAIRLVTGTPGEYKQEFIETMDFIATKLVAGRTVVHPFAVMKIYPSTGLWEKGGGHCLIASDALAIDRWTCPDGNNFYVRKIQQNQLHYHILKFNIPYNPDDLFVVPKMSRFNPVAVFTEKKYRLNSYFNPWHTYRSDILSKSIINFVWGKTAVVEKNEIDYPVIEGIETENRAFIGPETVHLDITNSCNFNCIACWDRSPLIRDRDDLKHEEYLRQHLSYEQILHFIDDIIKLGGVRFLKFSGGGEPTMHPRFADILTYLREKDRYVEIDINTNFSLISEKLLQTILAQRVDLLTVSLWAASPETYVETHPNQKKEIFLQIVKNLKRLKSEPDNRVLRVFLHNVLMRQNHHEVEAMVELGLTVGADEVHFAMVDLVPGKTESLLLTAKEHQVVFESLGRIKPHVDRHNMYHDPGTGRTIQLTNFHEFFVKMSQQDVEQGVYDLKAVNQIPCYIGWLYTRIMADGRVVPCCKGHRLPMGNLNDKRFIDIWNSARYKTFRKKGLLLEKSDPYFSVMGSDGAGRTGCLNCDNIIHNTVMHDKYLCYADLPNWFRFKMKQWWEKLF